MADPMRPSLLTKLRASLAGERDAMVLEALRTAGKAAHDELLAADQAPEPLAPASPWDAPAATGSLLLAAWNGYALQTLGEQLLDAEYAVRPGGGRFDPWCLTDRTTVKRWKADADARRAVTELWRLDPEPATTLALKAQLDAAVAAGDLVLHRTRDGSTCYYECPWVPLYEVRRPFTIGGRDLRVLQQFTLHISAGNVPRGGKFERRVIVGPFESTGEVQY